MEYLDAAKEPVVVVVVVDFDDVAGAAGAAGFPGGEYAVGDAEIDAEYAVGGYAEVDAECGPEDRLMGATEEEVAVLVNMTGGLAARHTSPPSSTAPYSSSAPSPVERFAPRRQRQRQRQHWPRPQQWLLPALAALQDSPGPLRQRCTLPLCRDEAPGRGYFSETRGSWPSGADQARGCVFEEM